MKSPVKQERAASLCTQMTRLVFWSLAMGVLALISATDPATAQDRPVDLELVLSVDASGSVDDQEYALQLGGIAEAFRDPIIHQAIADGEFGAIAVALVVWADALRPKAETEWFYVSSAAEADFFARRVAGMPRTVIGSTGIGAGLAWSVRKMERNGYRGLRQVVDVSGDGRETPPPGRDGIDWSSPRHGTIA